MTLRSDFCYPRSPRLQGPSIKCLGYMKPCYALLSFNYARWFIVLLSSVVVLILITCSHVLQLQYHIIYLSTCPELNRILFYPIFFYLTFCLYILAFYLFDPSIVSGIFPQTRIYNYIYIFLVCTCECINLYIFSFFSLWILFLCIRFPTSLAVPICWR